MTKTHSRARLEPFAVSRPSREALSGFLATKPRMTLEARTLAEAGGIALTTSKWVLEGTGPNGKPMSGRTERRGRAPAA